MKKALLMAPAPSVLELFNKVNMDVLSDLSYQVHVTSNFEPTGEDGARISAFRDAMANRHAVCHHIPFYRGSLFKNIPAIRRYRALLKRERFDLVHVHTETGGLVTRLSMPGIQSTRFIYTPHGMACCRGCPLKNRLAYFPVSKWICAGMDAVVAINSEEYALLRNWRPETARYTHGIGLDLGRHDRSPDDAWRKRAEFGVPGDAFLILSVGELSGRKNHEAVIRAVSKLKARNIRCLICGAGPLEGRLRELIRAFNLSETVVLAGYREDINEILPEADAFALPSYYEGLPVALMEAMAAGLPAVCSRTGGNADLIEDGRNGFLCAPNDADGFAAALRRLMDDAGLRERMGRESRTRVRRFSAGTVAEELKNIYRE
jgi:glycosyltransferase involved in cell wall biosynthesis